MFFLLFFRGYSTRHTIEGLETWTTYKYRIKFTNDVGESEWSQPTMVSTTSESSGVYHQS